MADAVAEIQKKMLCVGGSAIVFYPKYSITENIHRAYYWIPVFRNYAMIMGMDWRKLLRIDMTIMSPIEKIEDFNPENNNYIDDNS